MTDPKQQSDARVSCAACQNDSRLLWKARDLNRHASNEEFGYYLCRSCGILYLSPIPLDLDRYYDKKHSSYAMPRSVEELRAQGEGFKPRLGIINRFAATGRLLDVGASHGTFSYLAQQNGFEVEAVEMDSASCRFIRELGIKAVCASTLDSAENLLGMYDVITLFHVIEHLRDASNTVSILARHLSPRGILVVSTPSPDSIQFKMLGRYWVNLDAPRHLVLIPLRTLTEYAAQNGLELAYATSSDAETLAFSKWSWEESISNFLISARMMPASGMRSTMTETNTWSFTKLLVLMQRFVGKAAAIGLAWLLNLVFTPWERSPRRGSSYTAVFRRKDHATPAKSCG